MSSVDRFFYGAPSRILFGNGVRRDLAPLMRKMGFRRGLLVTDRFFNRSTPLVKELVAMLATNGIDELVYEGGMPDPTVDLCVDAYAFAAGKGDLRQLDHVIGLGGGSNIDLGKVLAITLRFGGQPEDYVGEGKIPGKPLSLIAIATTSGTGSEITAGAVLINPRSATKVAVLDNDLRPTIAVIDPEITLTCPPRVTGDAGLDAMTHAIESYLTMTHIASLGKGRSIHLILGAIISRDCWRRNRSGSASYIFSAATGKAMISMRAWEWPIAAYWLRSPMPVRGSTRCTRLPTVSPISRIARMGAQTPSSCLTSWMRFARCGSPNSPMSDASPAPRETIGRRSRVKRACARARSSRPLGYR